MNWKLEVYESSFNIAVNCKTDDDCWEYTGTYRGKHIIGCVAKTQEECISSIECFLINNVISTENLLKLKKENLERFRKKMKKVRGKVNEN